LVLRQLKRCDLSADALPGDPTKFLEFLKRISNSYREAEQDRYTLERSLAVSSEEMQRLYEDLRCSSESALAVERDKLRAVINAMSDGLCVLLPDAEVGGRVRYMNVAAARLLLGRAGDERTDHPLHEVLQICVLPANMRARPVAGA
jgi:PAS domain-containing protein